jgi:hypothetical protein
LPRTGVGVGGTACSPTPETGRRPAISGVRQKRSFTITVR